MSDEVRYAGAWGPQELEAMIGAYRDILQEICETGCLAELSNSPISAREIRILAAKQVVVAAAFGVRTREELIALALSSISATAAG